MVQKYGGSSVADAERIRHVAGRIAARAEGGDRVVAVVSAMGDTTDRLIELANEVTSNPRPRELDMLFSTGEAVSSTLLSMALHELGSDAISLSGMQAGIRTDAVFGRAASRTSRQGASSASWRGGRIVIVAGFQGASDDFDITTLGRGAATRRRSRWQPRCAPIAAKSTRTSPASTAPTRASVRRRAAARHWLRGDAGAGGYRRAGDARAGRRGGRALRGCGSSSPAASRSTRPVR